MQTNENSLKILICFVPENKRRLIIIQIEFLEENY